MPEKIRRWLTAHPKWALTFVTFAALAPFLAKPFNIDDPLFIWAGQQIYLHPADPFGFDVNWAQAVFPMWNVTQNPPLACYYAALAAGFFGWNEIGLHLAFLIPAVAVILGTNRVARFFCGHPALVALATLFTPVFLASSLTIMCDVLMLAFWIWAIVMWVEGTERADFGKLAISGLLIALAALTKYYGASLIPLLAAYSLIRQRRFGRWITYLLIPVLMLCAYQVATQALYGHNLLYRAGEYTAFMKKFYGYSKLTATLTALAFTGGCVAVAVFFMPLLCGKWTFASLTGIGVLIAAIVFSKESIWENSGLRQWTSPTSVKLQIIFWAIGGAYVLILAVNDVLRHRDARSCLLMLWVLGTFSFGAFFNWMVNGRSILPMAPAVCILIVRGLEQNFPAGHKVWTRDAVICLAACAALALLVERADFLLAKAAYENAKEVSAKYHRAGKTLWFQGNWGFQYYMTAFGASAVDLADFSLQPGDDVAVPVNNIHFRPLNPETITLRETITAPKSRFLATMDQTMGAGFYGSLLGPLPFAFGNVPPEAIRIFTPKSTIQTVAPDYPIPGEPSRR